MLLLSWLFLWLIPIAVQSKVVPFLFLYYPPLLLLPSPQPDSSADEVPDNEGHQHNDDEFQYIRATFGL